jgi:mRNA interferase RelE/StbE
MNIFWTKKALEELDSLPTLIAKRIVEKVERLARKEDIDIKRLTGLPYYRLRVGDYRVIFDLEKEKITILCVKHRKNVYKAF